MSSSQAVIATPRQAAGAAAKPRQRLSPPLLVGCGAALMMVAGLLYWLEPGPAGTSDTPDPARVRAMQAARLQAVREREAIARAEQERLAAEEAAEKARRAAMLADAASEAKARAEREELTRRQAAAEETRRTAEETEDAWKRFYRPSANCADPAASATVECVNEYVKAKREFASRPTTGPTR